MSTTIIITLIGSLFVFLAFGMPIAWCMLGASILTILVDGSLPFTMVAQRLFNGCNVFALLAIPAFVLAGDLMTQGGVSKRLVNFCRALVGRTPGGLSIVSLITCAFFAAISGSSPATTAAVGGIMVPEMKKEGYPSDYSAAVQAIGGTLGIVIPPSISFVLYGNSTGVSTAALLASGVLPGIISCLFLCAYALWVAKHKGYPAGHPHSMKEVAKLFVGAIFAIIMPLIILGGIYTGVFTPTESAVVAAFYGLLVGTVIYRELSPTKLQKALANSAVTISSILIIVACAMLFNWLLTYYGISGLVTGSLIAFASSKLVFLFLSIVLLFIVGMFMDTTAATLVLAPMLAPAAVVVGIDPIHYGFLFVFMMSIGLASPPFGLCMYVAANIAEVGVLQVGKKLIPFIVVQLMCVLLFSLVPQISTFLPSLLK